MYIFCIHLISGIFTAAKISNPVKKVFGHSLGDQKKLKQKLMHI